MLQGGLSCRAVVLPSLRLGVAQGELSGLFGMLSVWYPRESCLWGHHCHCRSFTRIYLPRLWGGICFWALQKDKGNQQIKYHWGIFSNSKVTSKNRGDGEALGHLFTAVLILSSEQAALPTFPPSIPREKPRRLSRLR